MHIQYPDEVKTVAEILHKAGHESFLIGGAVRDQLLGKPAKDFDLTTDAKPKEVMRLFKRVIPTGIEHGTVTVMMRKLPVEITTYRLDGAYSDGRRPDQVAYTPNIVEDLKRRDFTINSIAYNVINGDLLDPNGGLEDLNLGIIRAIGNPDERFDEDGLRSIRACRFASQLKFNVEEETLEGIKRSLHRIPRLSKERIFDEMVKIIKTEKPSVSFHLFKETGILEILFPDLHKCIGVGQKGSHQFDVFEHSIYSCDGVPASEIEVRFAALFHDIGKVKALQENSDGSIHFHMHESISSKMAYRIMKDYRFPNNYIKKICHLIEQHMFHYQDEWKDNAVRRFIAKVGKENLSDLFLLRQGDIWGTDCRHRTNQNLLDFKERIAGVLEQEHAFRIKDLDIDGNRLNSLADIPKGPKMGQVLDFLLEAVLDDPAMNREAILLELAANYYKQLQ